MRPLVTPRRVPERGTLGLSDAVWAQAQRRPAVIAPLAGRDAIPASMAREAGRALGLSERTIYGLLRPLSGRSLIHHAAEHARKRLH